MLGTLADDLRALGVRAGAVVMVHASMRAVGVRAEALVDVLLSVLGPAGTLLLPAAELVAFAVAKMERAHGRGRR